MKLLMNTWTHKDALGFAYTYINGSTAINNPHVAKSCSNQNALDLDFKLSVKPIRLS